jgi:hypothetical protein
MGADITYRIRYTVIRPREVVQELFVFADTKEKALEQFNKMQLLEPVKSLISVMVAEDNEWGE